MSRQIGYWARHPYIRLNVRDYSEEWVGYPAILELIELAGTPREQAFLSALFLTGGRVSEVLALKKSMFEIRKRERVIVVRNMPLLKRYRKIEETRDEEGRRKWVTEKLQKTRKPFPIPLKEPLTPYLLNPAQLDRKHFRGGRLTFPFTLPCGKASLKVLGVLHH